MKQQPSCCEQTDNTYCQRYFRLLTIVLLLAATGCATNQPTPEVQHTGFDHLLENRFGPRPDIEKVGDLHRLSSEQIAEFKAYMRQPELKNRSPNERIADYLQRITENFSYNQKNQPAQNSLLSRSGNCMSLAVLTTALASEAGVDISYRLVAANPVYQWEGDLVQKGQHLQSVLFRPQLENHRFLIQRSGIRIDYYPEPGERYLRRVARPEYLSMYYNNLAANSLAVQDYNRVWWLLAESMQHQANNADALNIYALLYRRTNDAQRAEQIYLAGIEANPEDLVLMRNYRTLLRSLDRHADAAEITHLLASLEGAHPVDWIQAGSQEFHTGNYLEAIRYFNKAARIAPYMHEVYLGLARAYYALSDTRQTRHQLKLALTNAIRPSTRSIYQTKLDALASTAP